MKLKRKNFKRWKESKENSFDSISLLRPLIETTRFDLKKLCQIWRLPIYPDVTNQNLISTRNRIRMQLLPILRFFFNPQIDTIFAQFAQLNLQEQDYFDYLTTRLIKDLFSKKKVLQNKVLNPFKNLSHQQNLPFYKIKRGEYFTKPREIKFSQSNKFCKVKSGVFNETKNKENGSFMSGRQKRTNPYQTKMTFYKKANSQFLVSKDKVLLTFCKEKYREVGLHILYKFEFKNQPLFFIPLIIQKRINKKLIEYFLNKKVNFSHVEQLMKYLKDSQNLV